MGRSKLGSGSNGGDPRPIPGVTSENYIIRAEKFEDAEGTAMEYAHAAGKCFMIDGGMHGEQSAWRHYFHLKGMNDRVKEMKWWLDVKGQYAVPSQWPWQFDQSIDEHMFKPKGWA